MNSITISYSKITFFIKEIKKQNFIKTIDEQSVLNKLFLQKQNFADVYFHFGLLDKFAILNIHNAKLIIVNSNAMKNIILENIKDKKLNIEIIYPSLNIEYIKTNEAKKLKAKLYEELNISSKNKIILFSSKNFKAGGITKFLEIIEQVNYKYIQIIIAGSTNDIYSLKFKLNSYSFFDKLILLEDYKELDNLFLLADFFILPSTANTFSINVLKAMYYKCVVFVSKTNHSSEIVDVFSIIDNFSHTNTSFKLDSLFVREIELKSIKKQNKKIAKKFLLKQSLSKFKKLICKI